MLVCAPEIHLGRPELFKLRELGAQIEQVPNYSNQSGRLQVFRKMISGEWNEARRLRKVLKKFCPDLVFLNQGGTADAITEPELQRYAKENRIPFALFCRSDRRLAPLPEKRRDENLNLFGHAYRVLFNSSWMLELTEKQLLTKLPNAGIFPHVVRFERIM